MADIELNDALKDTVAGDMLGTLRNAEVSITGATTLTSTAFGKSHVCSGTSADYTVTLPPASGNEGKSIGIRMADGLTKLVTIDGNGSEQIDGLASFDMWKTESVVLLCDGVGWARVDFKLNNELTMAEQTGAGQTFPSNSLTTILWSAVSASMFTYASGVFTCNVPGTYHLSANAYPEPLASGTTAALLIRVNGTTIAEVAFKTQSGQTSLPLDKSVEIEAGDTVELLLFHNDPAGKTLVGTGAYNYLTIERTSA